ncbi:MAG TPA: glycosyltransferase family 2 protein [Thermoflexales bacterium]|nr:glycosyltransferase family 2 protein [Thermoflexales bacterium]
MDSVTASNPQSAERRVSVAAVIITLNESANIARCLARLAWADERIVVDSGSVDDTLEIARSHGAVVVSHAWEGFSGQKNFGNGLASSEWILTVAADERVTSELSAEIRAFVDTAPDPVAAARIQIRDWMFGKFVEHGSWPEQHHIRLHRRNRATWGGEVHEGLIVDGDVVDLRHAILHFSHLTLERFIAKLNSYTDIEARTMKAAGQSVGLGRAALGALRAFLGQYVRLQGFRDGGHGFILAVYMAGYYFTTRAKLWVLNNANTPPPDPEGP